MAPFDVSKLESVEPRRPNPAVRAIATIVVAVASSLFLLFMLGPIVGLVSAGGARGVASLASDRELRASLLLTAVQRQSLRCSGSLVRRRSRTSSRDAHSADAPSFPR